MDYYYIMFRCRKNLSGRVAEGFRDYISQNGKILVLTPSGISSNNEILNIDKELSKIDNGHNKMYSVPEQNINI